MMAMATEKMGIMARGCGFHIVMATATEKIEFFSPLRCHCRHSVNEFINIENQGVNKLTSRKRDLTDVVGGSSSIIFFTLHGKNYQNFWQKKPALNQ